MLISSAPHCSNFTERRILVDHRNLWKSEPVTQWLAEKEKSRSEGNTHAQRRRHHKLSNIAPEGNADNSARLSSNYRHPQIPRPTSNKGPCANHQPPSNTALKILRTPLNLARRMGYLSHNPADGVDSLPPPVVEKSVFRVAQVGAMIQVAKPQWKGLILGGYYTGARIGDLSNLEWDTIDLDQKVIIFAQDKTDREVAIPIHPELLVRVCAPEQDDSFVPPRGKNHRRQE